MLLMAGPIGQFPTCILYQSCNPAPRYREAKTFMPDIILPGSAGRIEVRYQRQKNPGAPMALVLHSHPQFGGTMNNPLVYDLFHMFHKLGCTTVRFNFRGVGRSQGTFDIRAPANCRMPPPFWTG